MKKLFAVLLIVGCVSAALSALDLSAGLGGNFTANFNSIILSSDAPSGMKAEDMNSHLIGGGFYAFFDATYVELNMGLLFGNAIADKTDGWSSDAKKGTDITALKLGLFGKYPIYLGAVTFFPMAGIDGQINLAGKMNGKDVPSDIKDDFNKSFSYLWFKAGVGADIAITDKIYFRPEFLYGIRLNTDDERDTIDAKTPISVDPLDPTNIKTAKTVNSIIGHGLDIRLAIGYRF